MIDIYRHREVSADTLAAIIPLTSLSNGWLKTGPIKVFGSCLADSIVAIACGIGLHLWAGEKHITTGRRMFLILFLTGVLSK